MQKWPVVTAIREPVAVWLFFISRAVAAVKKMQPPRYPTSRIANRSWLCGCKESRGIRRGSLNPSIYSTAPHC